MEVTYYEDPACSWCWAFQPVATAFAFEFRHMIKVRHVMGGLRDRPAVDKDFVVHQWKKAEVLSGMPFDVGVWAKHTLETTFTACRAVKAAAILGEHGATRLLRRLREAFFTEQRSIDDLETILKLSSEVGIERDALRENLESGRAEELFTRDRAEAEQAGFGFPTINIMSKKQEAPVLLQGAVDYGEILETLFGLGIAQRKRRRFKDSREDWETLFGIHRRLTFAEIRLVTGVDKGGLESRLGEIGLRRSGVFYEWNRAARPAAAATSAKATASAASACSSCAPVGMTDCSEDLAEPFLEKNGANLAGHNTPAAEHRQDAGDQPLAPDQLGDLPDAGPPG